MSGPRACIMGYPAAHSRSPMLHGYWLRTLGIDGTYEFAEVPPDAFAAFFERKFMDCLAIPKQEVESDEVRGNLLRELAHPAFGGMEAHLQRVEVERSVPRDHDLAVDGRVRLQLLPERLQLREIAEEGTAITAPEMQLAGHVLEDPAETIPLRLVLPAVRLGQLIHELGLHRRKRKLGRNRRSHCAV